MRLLITIVLVNLLLLPLFSGDTSAVETEKLLVAAFEYSFMKHCRLKISELEALSNETEDNFISIIKWDYHSRYPGCYTEALVKRIGAVDLSMAPEPYQRAIKAFKKKKIKKSLKLLGKKTISRQQYTAQQLKDINFLEAVLHVARLEIELADKSLEKAISLFPEDWDLRMLHANILACFDKNGRVVELSKDLIANGNTKLNKQRLISLYIETCDDVDTLLSSIDHYMKTIEDDDLWLEIAENFGGILPTGEFYQSYLYEEKKIAYASVSCLIFERYAKKDPERYLNRYADALIKLGHVCYRDHKYSSALEYLTKSLRIHEELERTRPVFNNSGARLALHYLDFFKSEARQLPEARKAKKIILEYYKRRESEEPGKYQGAIAENLKDLGDIEIEFPSYDKARDYYLQALEIYRILARDDSIDFRSDLASTLRSLGLVCNAMDDFKMALQYYNDSLAIYQDLAQKPPHLFKDEAKQLLHEINTLINRKK